MLYSPGRMATASLDEDVQRLERWLQELIDQQPAGARSPVVPEGTDLPELTGPLKILLPRLAALRLGPRGPEARHHRPTRLQTLLEMTIELSQRCEQIDRAHARLRVVPPEVGMEESPIDTALLCKIDHDRHVAEATVQVFMLARELGPRTAALGKRVAELQRRAAGLHLRRLELLANPAAYPGGVVPQEILDERQLWIDAVGSGRPVGHKGLSPDEVATTWLDKSADLVALYTMIEERGHADPFAWFREDRVKPSIRLLNGSSEDEAESWGQCLRRLEQLGRRRLLFVAGSTHPGEDQLLADAFGAARGDRRDTTLVLVPRHWEMRNAPQAELRQAVRRAAESLGDVRFFSELRDEDEPDAVIVRCTGMLRAIYGVGRGAFVGGTLTAAMGHNVCEPLVWGLPTWSGPNHHANIVEWEEARAAMDPYLCSVDTPQLAAMFTEWLEMVETGELERRRPAVKAALDAYLGDLARQSPSRVQSVPRAVWQCATRIGTDGCPDCDGAFTSCVHAKELERYRMAGERRLRWFIPRFARFILERTDG